MVFSHSPNTTPPLGCENPFFDIKLSLNISVNLVICAATYIISGAIEKPFVALERTEVSF